MTMDADHPLDQQPARDLTNRVLGDFRILRPLGRGGMAEVFLALQLSLGRNVALKVLRTDALRTQDDVLLKRFQQEAMAAAGLNHANIVQVYAVGEVDGLHYIAQEYVQGMNLREYIRRNGPPSWHIALKLMRQALGALQAAGESGIVHRDIKPENLLVNRRGELKIADFGLAQLDRKPQDVKLTEHGTTMGTPLYMSPEQVNGEPTDQRSDVYSLGVTFYHLLAGEPPFRGATALSIAVQHVKTEPPDVSQRRPDLPPGISQIISRMMAKSPGERFADARSILKALRDLQRPAMVAGGQHASGDPVKSQAKRTPEALLLLSVCVGVFLVAALMGWLLSPASLLDVLRG